MANIARELMLIPPTTSGDRKFLFLLASARHEGNSELLSRHAAATLPPHIHQRWLRLADLPLPAFEDVRHSADGAYPIPEGNARVLLLETLTATDLVFAAPLYWYGLPASAKLYLDHWSGWLRVPGMDFKARMAGKRMWAISSYSDEDPRLAEPLFSTLKLTAAYMGMPWGGAVLGKGNRPGDVLTDPESLDAARRIFA
jgi:putative NADPH-quinone reductase